LKVRISIVLAAIAASLYTVTYFGLYLTLLPGPIERIELVVRGDVRIAAPLIYLQEGTDLTVQFKNAFFSEIHGDSSLVFDLDKKRVARAFRIYFQEPVSEIEISRLTIFSGSYHSTYAVESLASSGMQVSKLTNSNSLVFSSASKNAFVEASGFIYDSDIQYLLIGFAFLIASLSVLFFVLATNPAFFNLVQQFSAADWTILGFIIAIFLPNRFTNIALAFSMVVFIKKFDFRYFISNRVFLIILSCFLILILNLFLRDVDEDFSKLGKYAFFLLLPIYFSCVRNSRVIFFLPIAATTICIFALLKAGIVLSIIRNPDVLTFTNFVKEPIYLSYLLAFSIIYIEISVTRKEKYALQVFMLTMLALCGSKLVIATTLLAFGFFLKKNVRWSILIIIAGLSLLFFKPIKNRFVSILNINDLTIVREKEIQDPDDPRLNGLTFRIILWQEILRAQSNTCLFLFGNGDGSVSAEKLSTSLANRGLTRHTKFNAHNQYLSTFYKFGLLGTMGFLLLIGHILILSYRRNNTPLLFTAVLLIMASLSESVFERSIGIMIFSTLICLSHQTSDLSVGGTKLHKKVQ
jgi:hypothetical protein